MISWEKYLTETVTTYRKEFRRLSYRSQTLIRETALHDSLLEPCQIEVFDAGVEKSTVLLVAHDNNLPDMTFKIHENVENLDASEFIKSYEFIHEKGLIERDLAYRSGYHNVYMKGFMVAISRDGPQHLAISLFLYLEDMVKTEQVNVIEHTTEGLKDTISKISEEDIKDELFATARKIDGSLQEIRRLDEEIGKVRQLVGVTKEFQDWKLLISDVSRLKGEHVPREVFESKINELSTKIRAFEKIEEAYERLANQQAEVMKQQSSFMNWIKYSTILLPIAVASIAIIEILIRYFLGVL